MAGPCHSVGSTNSHTAAAHTIHADSHCVSRKCTFLFFRFSFFSNSCSLSSVCPDCLRSASFVAGPLPADVNAGLRQNTRPKTKHMAWRGVSHFPSVVEPVPETWKTSGGWQLGLSFIMWDDTWHDRMWHGTNGGVLNLPKTFHRSPPPSFQCVLWLGQEAGFGRESKTPRGQMNRRVIQRGVV